MKTKINATSQASKTKAGATRAATQEDRLKRILKSNGRRNDDGEYSLSLPTILVVDGHCIRSIAIIGDFEWLYAAAEDGMHYYLDSEAATIVLNALTRRRK